MNSQAELPIQGFGYVYVITHPNAKGLTKIGLTRNPERRESELGGDGLTIICRVLVEEPEQLERQLHKKFATERVPQPEWFCLTDEQAEQVLSTMILAHNKCLRHVVRPGKTIE